jgi:hypothetical protein
METQPSPAETLPALYRAILDGVAELERRGVRGEAALVRAEAIAIYSTSWDDVGRRRLSALIRRIHRVTAGQERPRHPRTGVRAPIRPPRPARAARTR